MKTFKEFLEEAYLVEMRKEDKVKGKKKTPLYLTKKYTTVQRAPEGSGKKWETKKTEKKQINPVADLGRYKQGKVGGAAAVQLVHRLHRCRVPADRCRLSLHEAHHLLAAGGAGPSLQLGRPGGLDRHAGRARPAGDPALSRRRGLDARL